MSLKRALAAATSAALLIACGGSTAQPSTTTSASTSAATTTSGSGGTTTTKGAATTTGATAASGSLKAPAKIGTLVKIENPQFDQVAASVTQSLQQATIKDRLVAFYGEGSVPSFFLVAVLLEGGSQVSSDLILNSLIAGIAGTSDLNKASVVDKSDNGVPFKCGTTNQTGSAAQQTSFCSWTKGDLLGIGIAIPGAGPKDVEGTFQISAQAATALG